MSAVSPRRLDRRQRERQPGPRDDRVGAGVDGGAHRGLVVALQGDHDVDAGVAAAGLGRHDFAPHGLVGADLVADALADHAVQAGAREQPEAPGDGHGAGERVERHADAHAALDDRQGDAHAFDCERRERGDRDQRELPCFFQYTREAYRGVALTADDAYPCGVMTPLRRGPILAARSTRSPGGRQTGCDARHTRGGALSQ